MNTTDLLKLFNDYTSSVEASKPKRGYLGLSAIGDDCPRKTFLGWRFAAFETFPPRILRLFSRGHLEEPRFVDMLRGAGFPTHDVDPSTNEQFEVSWFEGHVKGHTDGITIVNNETYLVEMKTASNRKFLEFKRTNDLLTANYRYYAQMQCYMKGLDLNRGLFMVVNKDNDELYLEIVDYHEETYQRMKDRCVSLLNATKIPERCSQDKNFFKCGYCFFKPQCFLGAEYNTSCRMCQHVVLEAQGKWVCIRKDKDKPVNLHINTQFEGCKHFNILPG